MTADELPDGYHSMSLQDQQHADCAAFLAACCVAETEAITLHNDLYRAYCAWATRTQRTVMTFIIFNKRLGTRIVRMEYRDRRYWIGIKLASEVV